MERYLEGDIPSVEELEKTLAHGRGVGHRLPRPVRLGAEGHRRRPARHLHLRDRPGTRRSGRRVVVRAGDHDAEISTDPAASPWPWSSRRWPTPTSARSRCSRCCRGRSAPTPCSPTPAPTTTRSCTACSPSGARSRTRSTRCPPATSAAVAKLGNVNTGDTLAPKGTPVVVPLPQPTAVQVLSIAIRPKSKGDEDKLMTALHRLQEEDPALSVRRNDETHQTLLGGMGETHLAIDHRAAGPEVRRRGGDRGRHRRLPGDDQRQGRGGGQVQEADRRPRPVRRRLPPGRAPLTGRRLQLLRRHRRRGHPPPVHPRRAERASRRPWPRPACSATRWSTSR